MKCGVQLGKEVPVVFGGVNYPNWGLLKRHPNVTGFHDKIAFNKNVSVAKELFGEHVRLFTMLDTTYIDKQIRRDAKEQFKGHKVTGFIDNPELSLEEQIRLTQEEGYTRFMLFLYVMPEIIRTPPLCGCEQKLPRSMLYSAETGLYYH